MHIIDEKECYYINEVVLKNKSDTSEQTPADLPSAEDKTRDPDEALFCGRWGKWQKEGLFSRLKSGLSKTRQILTPDIKNLFQGNHSLRFSLHDNIDQLHI